MMYLLFASKPVNASVRLTFCLINTLSRVDKYSSPCGHSGAPDGTVIQSSILKRTRGKTEDDSY